MGDKYYLQSDAESIREACDECCAEILGILSSSVDIETAATVWFKGLNTVLSNQHMLSLMLLTLEAELKALDKWLTAKSDIVRNEVDASIKRESELVRESLSEKLDILGNDLKEVIERSLEEIQFMLEG